MQKILIVEDDEVIAGEVAKHLEKWQMQAVTATDFAAVTDTFLKEQPDLVLMDLKLPAYNGFYWCSEIRKVSRVPIVFISSADDNMNIVMAMNMGADDFIAKPFDLQVLVAKLQAILRRSYGEALGKRSLSIGNVELSLDDTSVKVNGEKLELTKNEYLILKVLMEHPGQVVSREQLMERLWGDEEFVDDNTLTVNVTRIRRKLEQAGAAEFITTRRGLGYVVGKA
ncbi:MAG: response regulator transcription factor [Lachnospiraceae bacterium]|nr:response regulator transcription factor [Lachnospiraceae bacterium]